MSDFAINVYDASGNAVIVPGVLTVQPERWAAIAKGGMWDADVALRGPLLELVGLASWLGYRLEIVNRNGTPVWWGDILAVDVIAGGLRRGISLEGLANRCSLRYSQIQAGGAVAAADTAWSNDTASQTKYGVWQKRLSASRNLVASEASAILATALMTLAQPHFSLQQDITPQLARLYCSGPWQRLRRSYYSYAGGLEENNLSSGTAQRLGQGFTSSAVSFVASDKTIRVSSAQFIGFASGTKVRVSGSANNNGNYDVTGVSSDGNKLTVGSTLTNESVGASVTVTVYGQRYYGTFSLAANIAWTVAGVELRLRKIGSPADGITVQLVNDSSGIPGAVIETVTVTAANILTTMGWIAFAFANTNSLAYGTTYGLLITRSGANDAANCYEIDTDTASGYTRGALKAYDGATYQTPYTAADLIFRVLGALDTGKQTGLILAASPKWTTAVDVPTSGVVSNQYRSGELTMYDEMDVLLDMGTNQAARMIARTTRELAAIVAAKPSSGTARLALDGTRLTDLYGQDVEPGFLPAGEWVRMGDMSELGPWAVMSPVFAERAEYRWDRGLTIEPEGDSLSLSLGVSDG